MSLWLQLEPAVAGSRRALDTVLAAIPWHAGQLDDGCQGLPLRFVREARC
jgi:hypothetical protein